ncbi:hypothetical protein VTK73DRAFT_9213 [Phialemonium thermophilum]|uniref:Uncharacterized protein n=1 Tax=Phialemonium thermophilum TaxID=223376 RepID=A0ABR3W3S1_9PEZI
MTSNGIMRTTEVQVAYGEGNMRHERDDGKFGYTTTSTGSLMPKSVPIVLSPNFLGFILSSPKEESHAANAELDRCGGAQIWA